MSEDEHDVAGNRESPMVYNGGVTIGPPAAPADSTPAAEQADDDAEHTPVYDGLPGFPPGGQGRTWQGQRRSHPPLDCPNPKIMSTFRGFYRCPACTAKVRLAGHQSYRESGYELADRWVPAIAEGIAQVWWILWDSAVFLARLLAWIVRKLRVKAGNRGKTNGGVTPEQAGQVVATLAAMTVIAMRYRPIEENNPTRRSK